MTRRSLLHLVPFLALRKKPLREITIGRDTKGTFYAYWISPDGSWHAESFERLNQATTFASRHLTLDET